jgi:protein-tyrosine phosphatase
VADGIAALQPLLDGAGIPITLVPGGELAASRALDLTEDELAGLRLGGGEWLLLECPLSVTAVGFETIARALQARGHRILLAHPERSPALHRAPETIDALVAEGMLCSITSGSLLGRFGSTVRQFTLDLIERGLVHNLASDAHDTTRRPPVLTEAIAAGDDELPGLAEHGAWLTVDVPGAILAGGPVPPRPGEPPRRQRRGLLRRRGAGRSR